MMTKVKLTYFVDVLSSWCLIAEDALERVRREFGERLDYEWRIASLRDSLDYTREMLEFYYKRTNSVTGTMLNPVWLQGREDGPKWADLAAEAARGLGCVDDRVRLALARGAMVEGRHMGRRDVCVATAAKAGDLKPADLERAMDDPQTLARIKASSGAFAAYNVPVRPTFVVRNPIGDVYVLSGCWRYELLAQAIRDAVSDADVYATFMSQNKAPAGVV